jgi:outer membrane protein
MPEFKEATANYEAYAKDLQNQLEMIQVELNQKYTDYQKNVNTYTDTIRQMKESELQDLSQRLGNFQQIAQQDLQQKELELMKPVEDKAFEAINKVAKEGGFLVVFSTANDQPAAAGLAYFDAEALIDITADVKKSLGIE